MPNYDFPVPRPRGLQSDNECGQEDPSGDSACINGVVIYPLLGRYTSYNGETHELETIFNPAINAIDIDVPDYVLDSLETIGLGPNYQRYRNWLLKSGDFKSGDFNASDVIYDNSGSGLASSDVQDAIDEVYGLLGDESLWDRIPTTSSGYVLTSQNEGDTLQIEDLVVTGTGSFNNSVIVGEAANPTSPIDGEIRFNGEYFQGYNGTNWKSFPIPEYANMRTVSHNGDAQYSTIQSAIDSIADAGPDNEYVVLIFPGTYEEELTIPSNITLFGHSRTKGPVIKSTGSANPLITITDDNGAGSVGFRHIGFEMEEPQNNVPMFLCEDAASYSAVSCRMTINRTSDGISIIFSENTGSSFARFDSCLFAMNLSGTNATSKEHKLFNVRGNSYLILLNNTININIEDENDTISIVDNSSNNINNINIVTFNRIFLNISHASYSGEAHFYFTDKKDVLQEIGFNYCRFKSASGGVSGTAEFLHIEAGTGANVKSTSNFVRLLGFNVASIANIAAGDSAISHFDDVEGDSGSILSSTGAGDFDHVYSPADGDLRISNRLSVGGDISSQTKIGFYAGSEWTNKSLLSVKHFDPGVGVGATFDTVTSVDINSGKAVGVRTIGNNFQSGVWYSNGTIGLGPGTGTRDVFISRSDTGELTISNNPFSPTGGDLNVIGSGTFGDSVIVGDTPNPTSPINGEIRWDGSDFEGYTGSEWESFTAGNIGKAKHSVINIDNTDSPYAASYGELILCDCTSGNITVELPTGVGNAGKELNIKKMDLSVNTVIINGNGVETVDGETSQTLTAQHDSITIVSADTEMVII